MSDSAVSGDTVRETQMGEAAKEAKVSHPLTIPNYRWLFFTQVLAALSSAFYTIPFMWWAVEENSSGSLSASLGMVGAISSLVVAPWAGVLADRSAKKRIIQTSYLLDIVLMAIGAVLMASHQLQIWQAFALTASLSAVGNLRSPSSMALQPKLVPRHMYQRATAFSQLALTICSLASFSLAGSASAFLGTAYGFGVGIALLLFASLTLLPLKEPKIVRTEKPKNLGSSFLEGLRYVFKIPFLVSVVVVSNTLNLVLAPLSALSAPYIKSMDGNAAQLGMLTTAILAGQLSGLALMNIVKFRKPVSTLFIGTLFVALGIGGLAVAPNFYVALACLAVAGFSATLMNVQIQTLIQLIISQEVLGRVGGTMQALNAGVQPLGYALAGVLLSTMTPREIFAGMGILLAILSFLWVVRSVRQSILDARV
ncbi:MAG: MFS transporter [Trueperaceae bacterium]